ncbi:MAG: efflux RND transporter periplasmic adaptor subunit [Bacillota bacterium]
MSWKKWGFAGLGAVLVLGIIAQAVLKKVEVDLAPVKKDDVVATVTEKGRIVSSNAKDIYSEVQGRVKKVNVDTGDTVKQGTVLAELDVADIDQQIARLEGELMAVRGSEEAAQLQGAGSQVKQQQLAVDQARVIFNQANSAYTRTLQLYNEGAATLAELERAQTELATGRKALEQAEAALAAAQKQSKGSGISFRGQRESLEAQLGFLKAQKAKATIITDREGTVFTRKVQEGDMISPGALLFTVGSLGRVEIETYVSSKDIANVKKGDGVTLTFKEPGKDTEAGGVITKVSPVTEERVSPLGIIEDKIKVTVEIKHQPAGVNLIPGRAVDVTITTQRARNVLAVPVDAVFTDRGKDFIWVVKKGTAAPVRVEKGIEGDELVEIKSGVTATDYVILNPHQTDLKEGIKVKQRK